MVSSLKIKDMVLTAVFAALLCAIAPFSIWIGPVPVTLTTFAVFLAPSVLGWKRGMTAVLVFLLIGLIGLPVFSNFTGGPQKFVGSTGGYLIAYIPCAFLTGIITSALKNKVWANALSMVIASIVLYAFGTAWFIVVSGSSLQYAWTVCILPFLPFDAAKIVLVAAVASPLRAALREQTR